MVPKTFSVDLLYYQPIPYYQLLTYLVKLLTNKVSIGFINY